MHTQARMRIYARFSLRRKPDPSSQWEELVLKSSVKIMADDLPLPIIDDWLAPEEVEIKRYEGDSIARCSIASI
jgi:hypothetical protein